MADVAGKELLKKLLGAKVFNQNGEYVGYLKRVYIDKKKGKASKIVIRLLNGGLLALNPSDAILGPDGRVLLLSRVNVEARDFMGELGRLETAVIELRSLRESLLELDEAFIAGGISRETYQCFRIALEQKKRRVIADVKKLVEELEPYVHKLDEERKLLLREASGKEGSAVLQKLRELRGMLARVYELMDSAAHELAMEMELDEFIERYLRTG